MTAAHRYDELHQLVDALTPAQAEAVRGVVLQFVRPYPAGRPTPDRQRRRLSFAGIMSAEPDLADRSEEILRSELGAQPG